MYEDSEKYRKAAKEKAHRLVNVDPKQRVDASDYSPPDELTGYKKLVANRHRKKNTLKRLKLICGPKIRPKATSAAERSMERLRTTTLDVQSATVAEMSTSVLFAPMFQLADCMVLGLPPHTLALWPMRLD